MSEPFRSQMAIGLCVLSAALGTVSLLRHCGSISTVAIGAGSVWSATSSWLGNHFTRQAWQRLNKPLAAIYEDAKQGKLPRDRPLVRTMNHGGSLLIVAGFAALFM